MILKGKFKKSRENSLINKLYKKTKITNDKPIIIKKDIVNIKELRLIDTKRFGFQPKPGQSNYSRLCLKQL